MLAFFAATSRRISFYYYILFYSYHPQRSLTSLRDYPRASITTPKAPSYPNISSWPSTSKNSSPLYGPTTNAISYTVLTLYSMAHITEIPSMWASIWFSYHRFWPRASSWYASSALPPFLEQSTDCEQGTKSPTLIPLPDFLSIPYFDLNLGTISALLYSGYYILLEPVAGSMLLPAILGWTAYSNYLMTVCPSTALKGAAVVEVVSWAAQLLGHALFEGRAPALLDNVLSAFVLAPFFVFMEVLFTFGYRPELQKRMDLSVHQEIEKFKAKKANKAQ